VEGKTLSLPALLAMGAAALRQGSRLDLHYEPLNPIAISCRQPKLGERIVVTLVEQSSDDAEAASRRIATELVNRWAMIPRDESKSDLRTLWERAIQPATGGPMEVIQYDARSNVLLVKATHVWMTDFLRTWDTVSR